MATVAEARLSPEIGRALDLASAITRKSHFLLGPRQTGKSFLIARTVPQFRVYDLLDSATFLRLGQNPGLLEEQLQQDDRVVVIDEIQRLPSLLNEVHRLIETRHVNFLLTGSSARKLRRGGVNLLGGRARTRYLHPFTTRELGHEFDLNRALSRGLLPSIYFSDDPEADLKAYAGAYLEQEIAAEAATRNVPAFSRFLRVAALANAKIVNFTNIASDAQVPRTTVHEYFAILRDTLLMHELPAWRETIKRKPLASAKYYFFDIGVVSAITDRTPRPATPEFGEAFETYIFHELISSRDYRSDARVSYWRSTTGFEVDFIIDDHTAVEAKAKTSVTPQDLKSLMALAEEKLLKRYLCVCLETRPRKVGIVELLPYRMFLDQLWEGELS
jgi:uncharacterized protein